MKKTVKIENSISDLFPELVEQWNYKKNAPFGPDDFNMGSAKNVWWICSKGHEWQTSIYNRTKKQTGCPYCSNYYVFPGFNDLQTKYPDLAKEFDTIKNGIEPSQVLAGGGKKYWWVCPNGHSYETSMNRRTERRNGCPYCSGHRVLKGFNDIVTLNKYICSEWDYEKNNKNPELFSKGSSYKAYWICPNGHSYKASIQNRFNGQSCPICSHTQLVTGVNDLETTNPDLAKEWHPFKNGNIKSSDVFEGTAKKYWWLCPHGHEWLQSPHIRSKGRGCPICSNEIHVSFPEKVFYFYLKKVFPTIKQNYNPGWKGQRNIDIFIEDLNVGIEFDGGNWHKNIEQDLIKNDLCKKFNILLIRIRDEKCPKLENSYSYNFEFSDNYESAFNFISEVINKYKGIKVEVDINLDKDRTAINELVLSSKKQDNITITNPNEIKEWDYEKNGFLKPEFLTKGSTKKVWWKCAKGHSWLASIVNRCSHERGCPYCNNTFSTKGFNDLKTVHPSLCDWWDYEKNSKNPEDYVSGSGIKAWWKCTHDHSFLMPIRDMVENPHCPECRQLIMEMFPKQVTRNQHYVPQKYLRQWSVDKEHKMVFCSANSDHVIPIKTLCFKKDFYKLLSINKEEYIFLNTLVSNCKYVDKNIYKNSLDSLLALNRFNFEGTEFYDFYEKLLIQKGEDFTKLYEKELSLDLFNRLTSLDDTIIDKNEDKYSFSNYIFYQYFRTLKSREKLQENIQTISKTLNLINIRPEVISSTMCNLFQAIAADQAMNKNYNIQ